MEHRALGSIGTLTPRSRCRLAAFASRHPRAGAAGDGSRDRPQHVLYRDAPLLRDGRRAWAGPAPMSARSLRAAIFNRRMLICVFTGFASGLPLYVVFQLVPAWLRVEGVGLAEIGFLSLVQLPYTWKFLWAPIMDRYTLPLLGRRRGWMLVTQVAIMLSIAGLGFLEPKLSVWVVAYLGAALAFFSASQDIVLDAYRRELLPDEELGLGNTIHVQAYRLSGLVPGALALILADHLPWRSVFVVVGAFMLLAIGMTLFVAEPVRHAGAPRTVREAVVRPFLEFFDRKGPLAGLLVLSFLFLYKLGDSMATTLQTPFFVDLGFSLTQIGSVAKTASLVAAIVGGLAGGVIMIRLGINRALWLFGGVQIVSILGFAALAQIGVDSWALGTVVAFEYLGVGLGTAAFVAFMARETHPAFAATQLALFSALTAMPRTFAGATTGVLAERLGWTGFFLLCTAVAVPGMLLLLRVAPWNGDRLASAAGSPSGEAPAAAADSAPGGPPAPAQAGR